MSKGTGDKASEGQMTDLQSADLKATESRSVAPENAVGTTGGPAWTQAAAVAFASDDSQTGPA